MCFQFVDERLKLEKDLIKLKSENDWLRDAKRNLDRELECMRQQLLVALALPSSNGGGRFFFFFFEYYQLIVGHLHLRIFLLLIYI